MENSCLSQFRYVDVQGEDTDWTLCALRSFAALFEGGTWIDSSYVRSMDNGIEQLHLRFCEMTFALQAALMCRSFGDSTIIFYND